MLEEHRNYLLSTERLLALGTRNLEQRTKLLNEAFPETKIGKKRFRKLYKELGVKQRVLRMEIALTPG